MSTGNKKKDPARIYIFHITDKGRDLAIRLAGHYSAAEIIKFSSVLPSRLWNKADTLVFIMASGIVVRTIAPLIKDKKTDPAVIVIDEKGRHVISLISGHLGGANERAGEIAGFIGGEAVITTASDINELPSIDIWARDNDLVIEDWDLLPKIATRLMNKGRIFVWTDTDIDMPHEFVIAGRPESADMIISHSLIPEANKQILNLRPKDLILGIGCNSRTPADEIDEAVRSTCLEYGLSLHSVAGIATIDIKKTEPGLVAFAEKHGFDIISFTPEQLNSVQGITPSHAAKKATGAQAVAEPAAILGSAGGNLIVDKQKIGNVTVAVAEINRKRQKMKRGKISVVGTGPGSIEHITPYAQKVIRDADVIVGYGTYLDLISEMIGHKEVVSTGMTQEIDRCRKAIELASEGKSVAVISGGDPGIYAMAGLVLELMRGQGAEGTAVEIVPGISALNACASRLGAPLMHDFAAISLSDRLTDWNMIEKRLDAAASADFVIAIYNPKSKGRAEHIARARDIIIRHRNPDTPVGIVKGAMRDNESVVVTDLGHMLEHDIDMQTTVIIGNSKTIEWNGLMVTPRGYEKKKQYSKE